MQIARRTSKHKPVIADALLAVYDGRDRLGSYRRRDDDLYIAVDRLGREISVYDTALEAARAIGAAAAKAAAP